MTRFFMVLLASAAPHWVMSSVYAVCDPEHEAEFSIVIAGDEQGAAPTIADVHKMVIVAKGDGSEPVTGHWVTAQGEPMVVVAKSTAPMTKVEPDKTRGWLGVSVGDVPEALAAQLGTGKSGAIILDVVKESPAEQAGLLVHDVIMSVAGADVSDEEGAVSSTANLIGSHKPGETIRITILREGQQRSITATLGERPDLSSVVWKFNTMPHAQIEDHVRTHGRMLKKMGPGQWQMQDLGDLKNLPEKFKMFVPDGGQRSVRVFSTGKNKTVHIQTNNDDGSISVEQVDDGKITVRRTDKNGNETTVEYDDADELRKADSEAAELFDQSTNSVTVKIDALDGIGDIDIDLGDWDWEGNVEESFEEAREAYEKAMEEFHEAHAEMMETWKQQGEGQGLPKMHSFNWAVPQPGTTPPMVHGFAFGKARQSFEVRPDGSIEVRTRKGDSELTQVYTNEADLARRDPKMYEKYQELNSDDEND